MFDPYNVQAMVQHDDLCLIFHTFSDKYIPRVWITVYITMYKYHFTIQFP